MSARPRPTRSRAWGALRAAASLGTVGAVAAAALIAGPAPAGPGTDRIALSAATAQPPGPTRVRVSTFNVLGYGHTMPGGDRKGWLDGVTRQRMADQLIRANNLQIVGFQEMEWPQINQFKSEMGATYELFPGRTDSSYSVNVDGNSIAWRKDLWTALSKTFYNAPYFKGAMVPKPIVLLRNNVTGQQVFVTNTHNPADTKGDAQAYRNQAVDIQARTFNALRAQHPGVPIVFTGDMNDRRAFFCRFTKRSPMRAVNGGTRTSRTCVLPPSPQIDWIMSTTDVRWSGYQQLRTPYIRRTTDHPLVFADATIQPVAAQRAGIRRVVVLDIEGLPSAALVGRNARFAPQLRRLLAAGAGTLNARTDAETSASLPNLVSLLSGRPAAARYGGHGVTWHTDQPHRKGRRTTRSGTGHYVATLFDSVHDWGGSTSFMSSDDNAALVRRSYDGVRGATDTQGVRYGRAKLSASSLRSDDSRAVRVLRAQLRKHPRTVSVVQLSGLRRIGQKKGFLSPSYRTALRALDRKVGSIAATIHRSPRLAASTLLVVTADSGGHRRAAAGRALTNYQVPFLVWGHGVARGADLYALNPAYASPGSAQVGYAGRQPVRTGDVANLVTGVLGYPAVVGSRTRPTQDLNVFVTQ